MTLPAGHQVLTSELTALANPTVVGCKLRRVANQSINSGAETAISWDTADINTPSFITVTGSTLTVPQDGVYGITHMITGTTVSTRCFASIAVSSSTYTWPTAFRIEVVVVGTTTVPIGMGITIPMVAGDTIQGKAFHTTGTAQNFTGHMAVYLVGPVA
jgi:hypothetical protein